MENENEFLSITSAFEKKGEKENPKTKKSNFGKL